MKIRPNALVIIRRDRQVLASRGEDKIKGQIYYRPAGGGIEFGEKSSETIKREFLEELNASIVNEKLVCIVENIFEYNGDKGHEITFVYEADFEDKDLYKLEKIKRVDNDYEYVEWVSIDEIKNGNIIFYPQESIKYL